MHRARFDAPFWGLVLLGLFTAGSLGCFAMAAAAQDAGRVEAPLLAHDDTVY